jgi:hypothetical protein
MSLLFGNRKDPEAVVKEGLVHIRDFYGQILNLQRKVSEDITTFFNYQHREDRLLQDIKALEGFSKQERLRRARQIMDREHGLLGKEKAMLDEIRARLRETVNLVQRQLREIDRIEKRV